MSADGDGALEDQRAVSRETEARERALELMGSNADAAQSYVQWLSTEGLTRGLLGPREADRLWDRHILNCVVIAELVDDDARVADVGSGAGLPGIPLALARPDLSIVLIEPMLRRSEFLRETVELLQLRSTTVLRSRSEDVRDREGFDIATARAVAPLERLAGWTLPLLRPGGRLLAMKGSTAVDELSAASASLARMGATSCTIERVGAGLVDPPTTVVVVAR